MTAADIKWGHHVTARGRESFYANARLYDVMYPQSSAPGSRAAFYLDPVVFLDRRRMT